mmetsp:Transcript_16547/g.25264  ORF Transcript_16547/g.25264 Transcript_16547/m.25264 type:complete len:206 (+) Transcript_16547:416-1033(+)
MSDSAAVGAVVGPTVGPTEGLTEGPTVGPVVGLAVALSLGCGEGTPVTAIVGPSVGTRVGKRVGRRVEPLVGTRVGTCVGPSVGTRVGKRVGRRVGVRVGPAVFAPWVGCDEGMAESAIVGEAENGAAGGVKTASSTTSSLMLANATDCSLTSSFSSVTVNVIVYIPGLTHDIVVERVLGFSNIHPGGSMLHEKSNSSSTMTSSN